MDDRELAAWAWRLIRLHRDLMYRYKDVVADELPAVDQSLTMLIGAPLTGELALFEAEMERAGIEPRLSPDIERTD